MAFFFVLNEKIKINQPVLGGSRETYALLQKSKANQNTFGPILPKGNPANSEANKY